MASQRGFVPSVTHQVSFQLDFGNWPRTMSNHGSPRIAFCVGVRSFDPNPTGCRFHWHMRPGRNSESAWSWLAGPQTRWSANYTTAKNHGLRSSSFLSGSNGSKPTGLWIPVTTCFLGESSNRANHPMAHRSGENEQVLQAAAPMRLRMAGNAEEALEGSARLL